MNQIAWLRSQIDKAQLLLGDEDPNAPFSKRLEFSSMQAHIEDLKGQLRMELAARDKEVVTLRLKGETAKDGTIPLSFLAHVSAAFSGAMLRAAQFCRNPASSKGRIPVEVFEVLDLRLAALAPGSTKVILTGSCNPDMFGFSYFEDTLDRVFRILDAETPERVVEAVSRVGHQSGRKVGELMRVISNEKLETEISWRTPSGLHREWDANREKLVSTAETLRKLTTAQPEQFHFRGVVSMLNRNGKMGIAVENRGKDVIAEFPSLLLPNVQRFRLNDPISGIMEKNTIVNSVTGYEKSNYSVLEFDPVE